MQLHMLDHKRRNVSRRRVSEAFRERVETVPRYAIQDHTVARQGNHIVTDNGEIIL